MPQQGVRVELFGRLRLIRDTQPQTLSPSQKAAHLLAYLACHPAQETPREVLIERLWPDSDPEAGRVRLRTR